MGRRRTGRAQLRRRSREIALQLIYEMEVRPDFGIEDAIAVFPFDSEPEEPSLPEAEAAAEELVYTNDKLDLDSNEAEEVRQYACELARGVCDSSARIEELLRDNMIGWRPERMAVVDRAAISMALYEGFITESVPLAVAISEAVELSKAYGTEESGRFVNGVLGKIVRSEPAQ